MSNGSCSKHLDGISDGEGGARGSDLSHDGVDDVGASSESIVLGEGSKVQLKPQRSIRASSVSDSRVGAGIVKGSTETVGSASIPVSSKGTKGSRPGCRETVLSGRDRSVDSHWIQIVFCSKEGQMKVSNVLAVGEIASDNKKTGEDGKEEEMQDGRGEIKKCYSRNRGDESDH
jgi:hypothetical protein